MGAVRHTNNAGEPPTKKSRTACAPECPVCPHPGNNLSPDWKDVRRSKGLGTIDYGHHNMKWPRGLGNLQRGERYLNKSGLHVLYKSGQLSAAQESHVVRHRLSVAYYLSPPGSHRIVQARIASPLPRLATPTRLMAKHQSRTLALVAVVSWIAECIARRQKIHSKGRWRLVEDVERGRFGDGRVTRGRVRRHLKFDQAKLVHCALLYSPEYNYRDRSVRGIRDVSRSLPQLEGIENRVQLATAIYSGRTRHHHPLGAARVIRMGHGAEDAAASRCASVAASGLRRPGMQRRKETHKMRNDLGVWLAHSSGPHADRNLLWMRDFWNSVYDGARAGIRKKNYQKKDERPDLMENPLQPRILCTIAGRFERKRAAEAAQVFAARQAGRAAQAMESDDRDDHTKETTVTMIKPAPCPLAPLCSRASTLYLRPRVATPLSLPPASGSRGAVRWLEHHTAGVLIACFCYVHDLAVKGHEFSIIAILRGIFRRPGVACVRAVRGVESGTFARAVSFAYADEVCASTIKPDTPAFESYPATADTAAKDNRNNSQSRDGPRRVVLVVIRSLVSRRVETGTSPAAAPPTLSPRLAYHDS
ncbi:hypothetical protein C8R47DRAFT_1083728 [Mycena vitilis]|nr:hypothetical protein C8R47DRAFT_1083728 [Mycena vitilis]